MIDHMGFVVSDIDRSKAFYDAALAPLGIAPIMTVTPEQTGKGTALGYGRNGNPFFWIGNGERVGEGTHIALTADTRAEVDAFHRAALGAGGTGHGPPGLRDHYGPNCYAAFMLDPDGVNVETVCHAAE